MAAEFMIALPDESWVTASAMTYGAGAALSAGAAFYTAYFGDPARLDRRATIIACGAIALWCGCALLLEGEPVAALALPMRDFALLWLVFCLFAVDGRDESFRPTRPLLGALALVQICQMAVLAVLAQYDESTPAFSAVLELAILLEAMVAIGALVLLHNLYGGAAPSARVLIRPPATGLAGLFAYQLNAATIVWLVGEPMPGLIVLHGAFAGIMATVLAFGSRRAAAKVQFQPSRAVAFQTLSLLLIGGYVGLMIVIIRSLALLGGDVAHASQGLLLTIALLVACAWLSSRRVRDRLRLFAAKHLFSHRYDYRQEWLRFTHTVGRGSSKDASFHERAIKALGDITDSPAGLLLVPDEQAQLELSARWNWRTFDVPAVAAGFEFSELLETRNQVLDLDEARASMSRVLPDWLDGADDAWALVPLIHFERLVGVIVLARPRVERKLDWEDFELLRVVGRQLASYLAEQVGQEALLDAAQFDEFNRRMAFVMHDIKNIASQLSLLSANAQKHIDNPDFRDDMLVTLRNSSDKLSFLLARLGRYGQPQQRDLQEVQLVHLVNRLVARFRPIHPLVSAVREHVTVHADHDTLEQALVHLIQNAIDASAHDEPVYLNVHRAGLSGEIEIIDAGCGMAAQFVRSGLFKPFVSSKDGGFGIGAFEAREMIRAMDGRLTVESREGIGTRFRIALPQVRALRTLEHAKDTTRERVA